MGIGNIVLDMGCAGVANGLSTALLNPSDVVKLRLQSPGGAALYSGVGDCARKISAEQGIASLWTTALAATLLREALYSTTRMGLYPYIKQVLGVDNGLGGKIIAGAVTGGIGSIISNPIDVVKVSFMAEAGAVGADGCGCVPAIRRRGPALSPGCVLWPPRESLCEARRRVWREAC